MSVVSAVLRAKELGLRVHELTNELSVEATDRNRMGLSLLQLAKEHADSIVLLTENKHYGSGFALARLMVEAYTRGVWLLRHASDSDLKKYQKGECPKYPDLLVSIGKDSNTGGNWLSKLKELNWNHLNSLSHGGYCQVVRRNTIEGVEPSYDDDEVQNLLKLSGEISIRSAVEILQRASNEAGLIQLYEIAKKYRGPDTVSN